MSSSLQDRLARLSPEKRALLAKKLASKAASDQGAAATVPKVTPDPGNRFAPFPLTELQQAYWIGRSGVFELGSFAGHSYLEIENVFDLPRLNAAWQRLITRHDMLRAVFREDGSQQVLETVEPYRFAVHDLRDLDEATAGRETERLRHRISHQVLDSSRWPLFNIEAALLPGGRTRLFVGFDALIIDGWSMAVLFREWSQLYQDPDAALAPLELSFRDYVLAERRLPESSAWKRSESYWKERLPALPPAPVLPMARSPAEAEEGRFVRRQGRLDATSWSRIRELATGAGLTPTVIVLAAYAHVLGVWSNSTRFTLSIPQFNRFPLHPQANQIVGEAASFSLLEVDLGQGDSFTERARMIQQRLWEDLDHTYYNGVSVLRELARRNPDGNTLMPVVFTGSPQDPDGNDGYATNVARALGDVVYAINQTPQVWLDNHISEQDGELVCDWDTVEELFPEGMQDAMFDAFLSLLRRLASDETTWQASWPDMARSLVPREQLARRQAMNARVFDIPDLCLQELLVESAARHPDKPAVISSRRTLSYTQLLSMASRWAHRLRELGVKPGTLTAVVMEKGWEQAVAAYAVLFAGGAYAPMDPDQPGERLNTLIEDSKAGVILTQQRLDARFDWPAGPKRLCVDSDAADACPDEVPDTLQTPDDLAYVIYTSGSTGRPKGVMLAHRGVVNALLYTNETFGIGADDIGLGVAALHHDLSIYDLFGLLAAGGTLVLPDARDRRDPAHWSALLVRHQVTVWNSVPAMMSMLLEYAGNRRDAIPASLRCAFLGGDWIPLSLPERLRALAPQAQLISTGGPTETTLWNIWYPVESVDPAWRSIPYGRPIANARYYILNQALQPCPDWVAGEMCCAGIGVAKGYWQDEEKTREKFIDHPGLGEHLYRTGDLGRFTPAGHIEFVGRTDFQVKINGQRIETGEIEAALQRHPQVANAVVVAVGERGKPHLVAYVVPTGEPRPDTNALRDHLATRLPEYMIPTGFVSLDALPLTANGKVDRRSLPAWTETSAAGPAAESSGRLAEIEDRLSAFVGELMGRDNIDRNANLLSMGANSIDMVRIGNLLEQEYGFRPRMDEIFRLQSINAIAAYCQSNLEGDSTEAAPPESVDGVSSDLRRIIDSLETLRDPALREAFKQSQPGIREDDKPAIALHKPDDAELVARFDKRYSHRRFGLAPVPYEKFSALMLSLYQLRIDGKPRYLYPSPGGLYPTQVYVHVKPGRVEGIPAGTYYYHPRRHQLVVHTPDVDLKRNFHVPFVNTPVFDEAAFSLFLVTDLAAVAPSYGELSVFFAKLEAGVMAQLIETAALEQDLAICQTGGADFDKIRHLFDLQETHLFIHSLLGGTIFDRDKGYKINNVVTDEAAPARLRSLMERLAAISDEDARRILEAQRAVP